MKTQTNLRFTICDLRLPEGDTKSRGVPPVTRHSSPACRAEAQRRRVTRHGEQGKVHAFTLIELLVVISIIAIIAGFTLVVLKGLSKTKYITIATAEMRQIENALSDYKAKYGVYPPGNAITTGGAYPPWLVPPLYYELSGVSNTGTAFVTLDGSAQIPVGQVQNAFGIGGFINCYKGSGDEASPAKNFLLGLRQHQIATVTGDNGVPITNLVTSVRGPDVNYKPFGVPDVNPFRYMYPGTNNPNSYDLYVQLQISGKTYLICNWTKQVIVNSPLP